MGRVKLARRARLNPYFMSWLPLKEEELAHTVARRLEPSSRLPKRPTYHLQNYLLLGFGAWWLVVPEPLLERKLASIKEANGGAKLYPAQQLEGIVGEAPYPPSKV